MSHFVKYNVKVTNEDYLIKALEELGLGYTKDKKIVDYYQDTHFVDIAVVKEGNILPVGFFKNNKNSDSEYELVADWFATGLREKTFTENISKLHSKYKVLDTLDLLHWDVGDVVENEDGSLEVYASKFE